MLECYLHSRAKNLSGSRAPIDHYVYKGGYSDLPWGGKEGGRSRGAEKEGGKRGARAISIGSLGLSKHVWRWCVRVQLCMCVAYMHTVCAAPHQILPFL